MMHIYVVHYQLRKGLGPGWAPLTEEVALDDIPEDVPEYEIYDMARAEFKSRRYYRGSGEREYIITEIIKI